MSIRSADFGIIRRAAASLNNATDLVDTEKRKMHGRSASWSFEVGHEINKIREPWEPLLLLRRQASKLSPKDHVDLIEEGLQRGIAFAVKQLTQVLLEGDGEVSEEENVPLLRRAGRRHEWRRGVFRLHDC